MQIAIHRDTNNDIITHTDYRDIKDSGEIAHFITELEIIKLDMIDLWEKYHDEHDKT